MAATDVDAVRAIIKENYDDKKIGDLTLSADPFYELVRKDTTAEGDPIVVSMEYGNWMGRSSTFSTAQTNAAAPDFARVALSAKNVYAVPQITTLALRTAKGKKGAMVDVVERHVNGAFRGLAQDLSISLYRDGGGAIGQISAASTVASTTITLANIEEVENFSPGMILTLHSASTGGTDRTGTVTLTTVNRDTGVLTASGNWNAGDGTVAAEDFIKSSGDDDLKLKGLDSWIPSVAPSSSGDLDGTLDRRSDSRLSGVRYDGSSSSVSEAIVNAASRLGRAGGMPTACFVSFAKWQEIANSLEGQKRYSEKKASAFFEAVQIVGPNGAIDVYPSAHCQPNVAWLLTMDDWCLKSYGPAVGFLNDVVGNDWKQAHNADAIEGRVGGYVQLFCYAPGRSCRITLHS